MLDRRAFLRRLGFGTVAAAAAASGVLDIERLLWVPGEKTIFIPQGFEVDMWLSREMLRILHNNLRFAPDFRREYDKTFIPLAVGQSIRVPTPAARDKQTGIAIRFIQQFDIEAVKNPPRWRDGAS